MAAVNFVAGQGAQPESEADRAVLGCAGWIGNGNFWSTDMINYLCPGWTVRRTPIT
jgi:hypothetical protein